MFWIEIFQRLCQWNAKGGRDGFFWQIDAEHLLECQLEAMDDVMVAVEQRAIKIKQKSGILFHVIPPKRIGVSLWHI